MSSQVDAAGLAVVDPQTPPLDLTACDREPIHISGAIQPHGIMVIAELASLRVVAGAGQIEERLHPDWLGRTLQDLLGQPIEAALVQARTIRRSVASVGTVRGQSESFDATLHISGDHVVVELEPRPDLPASAVATLSRLDAFSTNFERSPDLISLCERAALAYRDLTGFDRVMVYRFLDDGAGTVLAEERDPKLSSFLNHHFPASDIPQQARALYIRNRVRVIPDVRYEPAPIRPAEAQLGAIDLSDSSLRSVSPIHIQYLKNMGVEASASISIVKDGLLWGLIACHNHQPRRISYETRIACQALAGGLARQIRAKEEAQIYRERLRLRSGEEKLVGRLSTERPGVDWFVAYGDEFSRLFNADGFAVVRDQQVSTSGVAPSAEQILALAAWIRTKSLIEPFVSMTLSDEYPPAENYTRLASGVLAINLTGESDALLLWFRVEHLETVEWAGNPHKNADTETGILSPRHSFAGWREEVSGRSRRWTVGEIEAASRLRRTLTAVRQSQRLRELNRQLGLTIAEKEALLAEKDHLLREVNHRVQNSLQLVQAFLALQANSTQDATLIDHLGEAQRRLSAVALVHRRLYQADQLETVDLSRYLEELIGDMISASGTEWGAQIRLDLAPVLISADRAVHVGLILTELVINANKYAYGGKPGPMAISIEEHGDKFRLIVADNGTGKVRTRVGFGTRMMEAMVQSLGGTLEQGDNHPGLRVIVTAPIDKI